MELVEREKEELTQSKRKSWERLRLRELAGPAAGEDSERTAGSHVFGESPSEKQDIHRITIVGVRVSRERKGKLNGSRVDR